MSSFNLKYALVLLISSIGFMVNVYGQLINDTIKIDEIEVVYQRDISQATINCIEIDSLTKSHYSLASLSELLSTNNTINIKNYGSGSTSTVSIRGAGASHTIVEWNGISINSPLTGQADFSLIPVDFVEDISIIPGGSSLQNSNGGLGGCVSLENNAKLNHDFRLKLSQKMASFGNYSAYAGAKWGKNKLYFSHRFTYSQGKNNFPYWRKIPLGKEKLNQENAKILQYGFLQEVYYRPNESNLFSAIFWGSNTEREIPALKSFDGGNHDEIQNDETYRLLLKWQKYNKYSSWLFQSAFVNKQLDYHLYHHILQNTINSDDLDLSIWESVVAADTKNSSNSFLNKFEYSYSKTESFKLNFKFDINQHKAKVENYVDTTGFSKSRNELSAFVGAHKKIGNRLSVSLMARNGFLDLENYYFAPFFGFEFKLHKHRNWKFTGNIARNYRYASINDLYYMPGGNPNLKPEKGISEELVLKIGETIIHQKIELIITAFSSHINNWILWTPTQFGWWTPENRDKVFARGIETNFALSGKVDFLKYKFDAGISFSKTTSESENDIDKGEQLIYVPKHRINSSLNLTHKNYFVRYSINYVGLRNTSYGVQSSYTELPAYVVNSMVLGKKIKVSKLNFGINFQVNNIFNVDYESVRQRAMPGRNFAVKLNIEL